MTTQAETGGLIADATLLALNAGYVNVVIFLSAFAATTPHMSGNTRSVSVGVVDGEWGAAGTAGLLIVSFIAGSAVSGALVKSREIDLVGFPYGRIFFLIAGLLFAAAALLASSVEPAIYMAAFAMGIQNGMATFYDGVVIRTTHVTGIATDIGIDLGYLIRRQPVRGSHFTIKLAVLLGFLGGGMIGVLMARALEDAALYPAAGYMLVLAVIYWLWRRRELAERGPT
jgi:uncharacterized membrane protein YoaK (UPF0700 family)